MFRFKIIQTSNESVNRFQIELRKIFNEIREHVEMMQSNEVALNEEIKVLQNEVKSIKGRIEELENA